MMYRCANDKLGYCSSEPEWEKQPSWVQAKDFKGELFKYPVGGTCKRDPEGCRKYRTLTQLIEKQTEAINA